MDMGYEQAPATRLVATRCGYCGRPLLEAESLKAGIGPVCRERIGYNRQLAPIVRERVNQLIYEVAALQELPEAASTIALNLVELEGYGFDVLVEAMCARVGLVHVLEIGADVRIKTPSFYMTDPDKHQKVVGAWRMIGSRWDREHKANVVRGTSKSTAWELLKKFYVGLWLVGPKGARQIG